jgi:hypothetical protein
MRATEFSIKEKYRYQCGFDSYLEYVVPVFPCGEMLMELGADN